MLTPTERQEILDEVDAGTFDLENALDEIATQQRGEGVRRALYGGILLVNKEGHAGVVDVKARQKMDLLKTDVDKQLDVLQKQMGAFIANNSGTTQATKIVETTLFSASSPTKNNQISISDEISNFDYIDIRYAAFGRTALVRFKPNDIALVAHWTEFENDYQVNGTTGNEYTALRKVEYVLSEYDNDTLIFNMYAWRWSGLATDNGVISEAIGQSWSVGIYSITGVKYQTVDTTTKDAELTDMRVGYDDTEYESAGEALRAQIQALWDAVNAINLSAVTVDQNGYLRFDDGGA